MAAERLQIYKEQVLQFKAAAKVRAWLAGRAGADASQCCCLLPACLPACLPAFLLLLLMMFM